MYRVRKVIDNSHQARGNDRRLALFENIRPIPNDISYNSYLLLDRRTVLLDTVGWDACRQFLESVEHVLNERDLDYLVINHMEPGHGASIKEVFLRYPKVGIISAEKDLLLMYQFGFSVDGCTEEIKESDTRCLGKHTITFIGAPMMYWPEAMVSFDIASGALFSVDVSGSSGALDDKLFNDKADFDRDWLDDVRRYYTNIVGKYGPHVQALLKKAGTIDVKVICPLYGPVQGNDFGYLLDRYDRRSRYELEKIGVLIVYAPMHGNMESAVQVLAVKLVEKGAGNVVVHGVSNTHVSYLISDAFKYSRIVLVSMTYNLGIYLVIHDSLMHMKALSIQKRTVGIIENGSWVPKSKFLMKDFLDNQMKQMNILSSEVSMTSTLNDNNKSEMDNLAGNITDSMEA